MLEYKQKRIIKKEEIYDMAKVIAVFWVIIGHATRMYSDNGAISTIKQSSFLSNVTQYIYSFHMPLFIFLSGCIWGNCIDKGKYDNVCKFIKNKILRLIIPYFCFGFFYVTPIILLLNLTELNFKEYFWWGIVLANDSRHLWYLLSLFWIFLFAIILKQILTFIKDDSIWKLVGVMILSFLIWYMEGKFPSILQIRSAMSYQIYFVVGVFANKYFPVLQKIFKYQVKVFGICVLFLFAQFFVTNKFLKLAYAFTGIVLSLDLSIILIRYNIIKQKFLEIIKKNSYGIYLFHPMIIYVIFDWGASKMIPPICLCVMAIIIATVLSCLFTILFRKIHLGFMIGEKFRAKTGAF